MRKADIATLQNLITATDIEKMLGVGVGAFHMIQRRAKDDSVPQPVAQFARTKVYWKPEVQKWVESRHKTSRRGGRDAS